MRSAPTVIGHDSGRAPHDRHPVRIGVRVTRTAPSTKRPMSRGLSIMQTRPVATAPPMLRPVTSARPFALTRRCEEPPGIGPRLHGFGPGLHDEQLPRFAVLGPFHVHRPTVMIFDHASPTRQRKNFVIRQNERAAPPREVGTLRVRASPRGIDHLAGLAADRFFDDRAQPRVRQQRLEHLIFIRLDSALHDILAQPPRRIDQHHAFESRFRYRWRTSRRRRRDPSGPCF